MRLAMWKDARDRAYLQSEVKRMINTPGFSLERKRKEMKERVDLRNA